MSAAELVYDYFEDHTRSADNVRHMRPVPFGVLCFSVAGLSIFTAQAVAGRLAPFSFSVPSLVLLVLWEVTAGLLLAAFLHLVMEFEGIQGSASSLFVLLGLADLVWAAAVPVALLIRFTTPHYGWATAGAFMLLGLVSLGYKARSIQDNYQVSAARAWMTLFVPYVALAVAGLLVFAVALIGVAKQLIQWLS